MGNLRVYFNWHYIVLMLIVLLIMRVTVSGEWNYMYFLLPLMVVVAIVQLITGISFTYQQLPIQFKHDWRTYWISSIIYFIILYGLYHGADKEATGILFEVWLLAVPWLIVLYQFHLVNRIHGWRNASGNTHKNHKP